MSDAVNRRKHSRRPVFTPPPTRVLVKLYDHDTAFSRDVQHMSRQGWSLTSFRSVQPCDSLGLIRASGPGMVPAPARFRIEASFSCRTVRQPDLATESGRLRGAVSFLRKVAPGTMTRPDVDRSSHSPAQC